MGYLVVAVRVWLMTKRPKEPAAGKGELTFGRSKGSKHGDNDMNTEKIDDLKKQIFLM